jgi:peptidoglycan hydrolase-like protein with peptidoglycan-binding domain
VWVVYLQKLLRRDSQNIAVDGDFGPKTRAAVINVQRFFRLVPDGIVGPKTWGALHL